MTGMSPDKARGSCDLRHMERVNGIKWYSGYRFNHTPPLRVDVGSILEYWFGRDCISLAGKTNLPR
jgi:hypothetical protein